MPIRNPHMHGLLAASAGFGDYDAFGGFFSKVKKIGKAAVKTVTTPVVMPLTIAKDIKSKGLKKGLKAIPSRAFVDPVTAGNRLGGATVAAIGGKKGTAMAARWDVAQGKLERWTQKRPIQTTIGAAVAVVGGYVALPAAVAAAPSAAASAASWAAANAATVAEIGGAVVAAGGAAMKGKGQAADQGATYSPDVPGVPSAEEAITAAAETGTSVSSVTATQAKGGILGPAAGAAAGFMVAGPVGALVGGIAGLFLSKK